MHSDIFLDQFRESENANLEAFQPYGSTPWYLYQNVFPYEFLERDRAAWREITN